MTGWRWRSERTVPRALVVVPPEPVVTPADVPGNHAADDVTVAAWIAAATAQIDGPAGTLGRAIGVQTIELRMNDWGALRAGCRDPLELPYPPIIEIVSVSYTDAADAEIVVAPADYALAGNILYTKSTFSSPEVGPEFEGVRVRYRAGYDGAVGGSPPIGTTGEVPAPIRQWIILRATQLISLAAADPLVRSETTVDLDSVTYATPDAGGVVDIPYRALLSPYQVF